MILNKSDFLEFKKTNCILNKDWYYVKRTNDTSCHDSAVCITTLLKRNDSYYFLFLKTIRPPMIAENKCKFCIESPAGLIGDEIENECVLDCIKKELLEETGFLTDKIYFELSNSASSAGLSSETFNYVTAIIEDLSIIKKPISDGGVIVDRFEIKVNELNAFLSNLDYKEYSISSALISGCYFALNRLKLLFI